MYCHWAALLEQNKYTLGSWKRTFGDFAGFWKCVWIATNAFGCVPSEKTPHRYILSTFETLNMNSFNESTFDFRD